MVGVEHGHPVYLTSFNTEAADTIGTDELWTTNSALLNGLSRLRLNGESTQLALWDSQGDVLTNHQEFVITDGMDEISSRVIDGDGVSTNGLNAHSTHIAGILVASGVDPRAKGMSPHATLIAHDVYNDFTEMTAAFANTNNHFRISNHSYGRMVGWSGTTNQMGWPYPIWWGNLSVDTTQDYRFGFYSEYSRPIDDIAWWSPHYLSVWAAGNERGNHGIPYGEPWGRLGLTISTNRYFALTNEVTTQITNGVTTRITNAILTPNPANVPVPRLMIL